MIKLIFFIIILHFFCSVLFFFVFVVAIFCNIFLPNYCATNRHYLLYFFSLIHLFNCFILLLFWLNYFLCFQSLFSSTLELKLIIHFILFLSILLFSLIFQFLFYFFLILVHPLNVVKTMLQTKGKQNSKTSTLIFFSVFSLSLKTSSTLNNKSHIYCNVLILGLHTYSIIIYSIRTQNHGYTS